MFNQKQFIQRGLAFALAAGASACSDSGRGTISDNWPANWPPNSPSGEIDNAPTDDGAGGVAPAPTPNAAMQAVLDKQAALGAKPIETLSVEEARRQPTPADAVKTIVAESGIVPLPDVALRGIEDRSIDGAEGPIAARFYYPVSEGVRPVIVYFHGGGFVIANRDVYDASARSLAKLTRAIVVSVEYRRAPEHRFPSAHDDAIAAYAWVARHAVEFGGDPTRLAVAGESAGGNLAINVSIKARDAGLPMPLHQLLIYPVASTDMSRPSYVQHANAKPLNRAMMGWFVGHYLASPEQKIDTRLNVVEASLRGLPPTTLIAAEIDPLLSEGEVLAERLVAAGVDTVYRRYDRVTHEFFGMALVLDEAKQAQRLAAERLTAALGNDGDVTSERRVP